MCGECVGQAMFSRTWSRKLRRAAESPDSTMAESSASLARMARSCSGVWGLKRISVSR